MSKSQLTGMAGVYYVAAELTMRGLLASPTSRGAHGADLLVADVDCKHTYSVQVKTNRSSFRFWLMSQKCKKMASSSLIYVLVNIKQAGLIEYYIVPSKIVAKRIRISERSSTRKQTWYSLYKQEVENFKDKWGVFDQ